MTGTGPTAVRAVLLDVDGTLIDSNDAHANAWVDAGAEFGYTIEFDEVRRLIGMGGDRVLPRLTGLDESSDAGQRLTERRGAIFRERYLPSLRAFDGVRALLERLRGDGVRLVVATSASEADLTPLLEQAGVADLIPDAADSDDAESSKPAPDIVEAALEHAGTEPGETVMLGDTPYDVAAARKAGVAIIALRCGGWDDVALAGATEIHADPAALLAAYGDSLIGRR